MKVNLLSIILFTACIHSAIQNKNEHISEKPIKETRNDFREFWKDLGQALRVNDTIALDKYLDTTVYFYGREDQDPIFELKNRERIIKVRDIYLTGGFYDFHNDANTSYVDFFLNGNALNCDFVEGQDNQNIKDFIFTKNKMNVWKLTAVYSDTKKLKKS